MRIEKKVFARAFFLVNWLVNATYIHTMTWLTDKGEAALSRDGFFRAVLSMPIIRRSHLSLSLSHASIHHDPSFIVIITVTSLSSPEYFQAKKTVLLNHYELCMIE